MALLDNKEMNITGNSDITYKTSAAGTDNTDFKYIPETKDTDGSDGYTSDWTKWHGYYREIPEFQAVTDKLGSWTVGRGFEADEKVKKKVGKWIGFGKDDFNSLLENFIRTMLIAGDCFAEIVKDKQGRITNIKPLNPGKMKIIANDFGIIEHYEHARKDKDPIIFQVEDIFHLSWNRIADEIHGIPYAEKMQDILQMRKESMKDLRLIFHGYAKPLIISKIDSDDATTIANYKAKLDEAVEKCENIIIPKDTVDMERMSIPQYSTLDPLPWLRFLIRQFITSSGVPEVVLGWGEETTEASSKIIYLAFQQTIERLQRYIEAQLKIQLNIEIDLVFPASLEVELQNDAKKDSGQMTEMNTNPNKDG